MKLSDEESEFIDQFQSNYSHYLSSMWTKWKNNFKIIF